MSKDGYLIKDLTVNNAALKRLVKVYIWQRRTNSQVWDDYFRNLPDLQSAIRRAALALGPDNKVHPHQQLIKKTVRQQVADCLVKKEATLRICKDFEEIMAIVTRCGKHGFGKLAIYDTAQRIGERLGISPERVYLHRGTKTGAKNLGLDTSRGYLLKDELPEPLQELEPDEIESFLCIFKDKFTLN
ncbi:MAG: hypothetical protein KDI79_08490 [Anaerolineae bacterium]|nr:hypothetical protein [Anaerolineae bacterium]